jgi:hypothetical protein
MAEGLVKDCHAHAHELGWELLALHEGNWFTAISECSLECVQGCQHGVLERYTADLTREELLSAMTSLCDVFNPHTGTYRQCVHGIGHGLLVSRKLTVEEAVDACGLGDPFFRWTCIGGLLMEHFDQYMQVHLSSLLFLYSSFFLFIGFSLFYLPSMPSTSTSINRDQHILSSKRQQPWQNSSLACVSLQHSIKTHRSSCCVTRQWGKA